MALLDPVEDNAALAIGLLVLYVAVFAAVLLPSADGDGTATRVLLWTVVPIALYAAVNVLRGTTFEMWGTVSRGVALASFVVFLLSLPRRQVELPLPVWQHLLILAPVALYVGFRAGRLAYLAWTEDPDGGVSA